MTDEQFWELRRSIEETRNRVRKIDKTIKLLCKMMLCVGIMDHDKRLSLEEWREMEHMVLTDIV